MNTAARLGAYGAGLAVVFGGAFVTADAVVPESTVTNWTKRAQGHEMSTTTTSHDDHGGRTGAGAPATAAPVPGVTTARDGYLLSPVAAPGGVGEAGRLSFRILDARGAAVTGFATSHEKRLHLIVVRTDGTRFRHVHPTMDRDGTWSLPWTWTAAGSYRVYADFVPAEGASEAVTLTRTVEVGGAFDPAPAAPTRVASVGGYDVRLTADLAVGAGSELTFTVSRDGEPVTGLQPYLGAFGHLVALREGDLAYLHVHPEGADPAANELSGPEIGFMAEVPTPGRYLLYLDFRVDDQVHSAPFVIDAVIDAGPAATSGADHSH